MNVAKLNFGGKDELRIVISVNCQIIIKYFSMIAMLQSYKNNTLR